MGDNLDFCVSVVGCVYNFQTLLAGILAVISAIFAGKAVIRAAKLPIEAEKNFKIDRLEQRRLFTCSLLSNEFMRVSELARQAEGTIQVVIAANGNVTDDVRAKTTIHEPPLLEDWEAMSLLSKETLKRVLGVRAILRRHNFDMSRAGGAFGADNFREQILRQVKELRNSAHELAIQLNNDGLLVKEN